MGFHPITPEPRSLPRRAGIEGDLYTACGLTEVVVRPAAQRLEQTGTLSLS